MPKGFGNAKNPAPAEPVGYDRDEFWRKLIARIEADVRRGFTRRPPERSEAPGLSSSPAASDLLYRVWQMGSVRARGPAIIRASRPMTVDIPAKASPSFDRLNAQPTEHPDRQDSDCVHYTSASGSTEAALIVEMLIRLGASFTLSELSITQEHVSISRRALHRERVRTLSRLHPDRAGALGQPRFQQAMTCFQELEALRDSTPDSVDEQL